MHERLSVNALSSIGWSFEQDLELWQQLGVRHAGLLISKIADDIPGKLDRLLETGIKPSTVVCGSFNLSEPNTWSAHQDHINQLADSLASRGCQSSIYFTPGRTTGAPWQEVLELFCDAVSPCVSVTQSLGIDLAFEPSLRTDVSFVNSLRDALDAAEQADLSLVADFANCWMERDLDKTLLRARDRISLVQIDDVQIGSSDGIPPATRVHIGDGDLPVDRLMQQVLRTGYQGVFDLEVLGAKVESLGYQTSLERGVPLANQWLTRILANG